ncbi:MAG: DUF3710 domain-containing protein [Bifidobacteriaceae bacterium]|jgi:hypothetical protein|nr:DUF3710 domain-containing protein [Bifidobacteriaceae bacterium]
MAWFSSRKAQAEPPADSAAEPAADPVDGVAGGAAEGADGAGGAPARRGPLDAGEVTARGARLDLGALWVPVRAGVAVRLEAERAGGKPMAVSLARDGSALRLEAFAAPRTAGVWDQMRAELAASITQSGGEAEEVQGPFGTELRAKLPARTADGRIGKRAARFFGADGPRWFVQGFLTGKAAMKPEAAAPFEELFADVVVNRGSDARPPRDRLDLHAPGAGRPEAAPADGDPLALPGRGPEIAEIQ